MVTLLPCPGLARPTKISVQQAVGSDRAAYHCILHLANR